MKRIIGLVVIALCVFVTSSWAMPPKGMFIGIGIPSPTVADWPVLMESAEFADYATPTNAFKWGAVEHERGSYDWRDTDAIAAWARAHGKRLRMHCALWDAAEGTPRWARALPAADRHTAALAYIAAVADRHPGLIYAWDINEPLHRPGLSAIGAEAVRIIRQHDPQTRIAVNEFDLMASPERPSQWLQQTLRYAKAIGADSIGIQLHDDTPWSIPALADTIAACKRAGFAVDVTEVTRSSSVLGEQAQARNYRRILRIAERMGAESVTFWTLTDRTAWTERPESGLLRKDGTRKPSYDVLAQGVR